MPMAKQTRIFNSRKEQGSEKAVCYVTSTRSIWFGSSLLGLSVAPSEMYFSLVRAHKRFRGDASTIVKSQEACTDMMFA